MHAFGLSLGTFVGLVNTSDGRILAVKPALASVLLGLAGANRWFFLRRLYRNDAGHYLSSLYRSVVLEQLLESASLPSLSCWQPRRRLNIHLGLGRTVHIPERGPPGGHPRAGGY